MKQRLRYRFDNAMARGVGSQIAMLAIVTLVLILVTSTLLTLTGLSPQGGDGEPVSFGRLVWLGLMHAIDPGAVGSDAGSWTFLFIMLAVSFGGIFVFSALIGVLTGGFGEILERLRKGRSVVIERDHTVILGWTGKIHALLAELAEANANRPGASVVILAEHDKVAMDDELRSVLGDVPMRVVTRTGSPLVRRDLDLVNLGEARSVIVMSPDGPEADTVVLKTLLAVAKAGDKAGKQPHVVAEIKSDKTLSVARMVVGDAAGLILTPPLISRVLVQTGRQSGLSVVYTELLSFSGAELYIQAQPQLAGKTFREALFAYEDSALVGIYTAAGERLMPPPFDRRFESGDQVIAISRDDDTVIANGRPTAVADAALAPLHPHAAPKPERTLVLGESQLLPLVLRELDAYVAPGSTILVVGEARHLAARLGGDELKHTAVQVRVGDVTDRAVLDGLDVAAFDNILVLAETEGRTQEMTDSRTMITLLHLRDILRRQGKSVPITSEMLDGQNRDLAAVTEADDFIISNTLVSLVVSQVSENRRIAAVLDDLLSPEGHEIYLKPARDYVQPGSDIDFYTVVEAAARRGEIALGYRLAARAHDSEKAYGVVLNPRKSERIRLAAGDRVIVLAEH
ncbi:potassium transporter TrkA [Nannocystis sp. ILAH1]|uniref:CASTOR/POLLUX-related putative ion channel n=1 Tax=unclassified Nannocystis TaxID=2627009 RepID=UPI00226DFFD0|nr:MULTISPECIES: potassium transporter TrkA [unclassified Nannocystis]MCY0993348.1 potassium transporter TrkA [Nannocystis sp. ILAH1]MCY1063219.1 potassium transporter TrkA [Nannocystis sp. RBIL2]